MVTKVVEAPPTGQKAVLLFWAPWHDDAVRLKDTVLPALASTASSSLDVLFGTVQAEEYPDLSASYGVTAVPTFVMVGPDGTTVLEKLEGIVDIAQVTQAVQRLVNNQQPPEKEQQAAAAAEGETTTTKEEDAAASEPPLLRDRLEGLIRSSQVMLFMKGTPDAPRCGFSRKAVELLRKEGIAFGTFDILTDDTVRQGLKEHSDWPTYPQLYAKGELIGGLDILQEMTQDEGGESLQEQLGIETIQDRLKKLIRRHKIMLFMKGLPSAPRCGFSRQMVEILDKEGVSYDSFNILEDNDVRQGLKKLSDWPTYPQLYVDGDLVGGLDIAKELAESGELSDLLNG